MFGSAATAVRIVASVEFAANRDFMSASHWRNSLTASSTTNASATTLSVSTSTSVCGGGSAGGANVLPLNDQPGPQFSFAPRTLAVWPVGAVHDSSASIVFTTT